MTTMRKTSELSDGIRAKPLIKTEEQCPLCTQYPGINIANHVVAVDIANLGPADPAQPSEEFWTAKAKKWGIPIGEARSRLCMNCKEYDNSQENMDCIKKGRGAKIKTSDLPFTPKWADIEGVPAAVCERFNITCTSIRTCDDWVDPTMEYDSRSQAY